MKISSRVIRVFFYGLVVAGVLYILFTLAARSFDAAANVTGLGAGWLAGLCCLAPFVLAGIALARESSG
ncbi:MAG: hypothetical protein AAF787_03550 [Chloroflexota bacterium]